MNVAIDQVTPAHPASAGKAGGALTTTSAPEQGPSNSSCGRTLSIVTGNSTDYGSLQCTARNIPASSIWRNTLGTTKNCATCRARHCPFARVTGNRTNYSALCHTSQCILPNLLISTVLRRQG